MTTSTRSHRPRVSASSRVAAETRGSGQAELPMYDCPEDALKGAVMALGGYKVVGPMLWPTKSIEAAAGFLRDCLNPERAEKLDFGQTIFILRSARDAGCYAPFQWAAAECGFDALPVSRAEEIDRVVSVVESSAKLLATSIATLERLQRARAVA